MSDPKREGGEWVDVGSAEELSRQPLTEVHVGRLKIALSFADGAFGAISGVCNHVGGPLGEGRLDGDYVECPWHYWKFHRVTGEGEPGFEADRVPRHDVRLEGGRVLVARAPATKRHKTPHEPHPLLRPLVRAPGALRVVGLSATVMDRAHPRYSTSEALLEHALGHARDSLGCEVQLIRLDSLRVRPCEGFYSRSAHACTWPCSITQMDPKDEMQVVYEALVHWADVVLLATPIRWGNASALYYKMAERLNCVQNQVTIRNNVLIRNKCAGFIITGGQDNIQAVAGQLLGFFGELGFHAPQFPYIAHSRGWTAEDMERNVSEVQQSEELREGARELVGRCVELARSLIGCAPCERTPRGGRKAHRLESERAGAALRALET
ncbi:MAG TPA: Rieske 2Fe-2S domain-containing protein [Myxococcota bacterium]|nr:Rieske 2Fe-2S domain-containing protein [Myxococcota bacterium]